MKTVGLALVLPGIAWLGLSAQTPIPASAEASTLNCAQSEPGAISPCGLRWTPDNLRSAAGPARANAAPSIFAALQEQLGLRLESQRGPVEFLVVDSIGQPTPD